ncbi:MAG: hypothetical protein OJI67_04640 [Prosthecobacter sp.]|nr:hypothetical protein [Prosthecobacter sp.]
MNNTIQWQLSDAESDRSTFYIYPIDHHWHDKFPAIYIMAKRISNGYWAPLYIGEAKDIGSRMADHERYDEAVRLGATHLHVCNMTYFSETERCKIEEGAIGYWNPPLNKQHKETFEEAIARLLGH